MPHFGNYAAAQHHKQMEDAQYYELKKQAEDIVSKHGESELVKIKDAGLFDLVSAELRAKGIKFFTVPQIDLTSDWIKGLYTWDQSTHYFLVGKSIPSPSNPAF